MVRLILFLGAFFLTFTTALCQTIVSASSGPWDEPATWVGGVVPDASNSTQIRILSGHVVNIPDGYNVQIDQLQIRLGGNLTIDEGGLLDVINASGNDLIIFTGSPNGQLLVDGTIELTQGATIVNYDGVTSINTTSETVTIGATGIYRHKYTTTSGTIIGADWQSGSTVEIVGYTSNSNRPINLSQPFHHFTWNCPAQTGIVDLKGNLNDVNGNLSILSTGGTAKGVLRFFYADNNITVNVGGDLVISGQSGVWFTGTGVGNTVNIDGELRIENSVEQLLARDGSITINCDNLNVANAASNLSMTSNATASATINLRNNFTVAGVLNAGSGIANVNFAGASPTVQFVSGSGTIGRINFAINTGAIVDVGVNSIRGTGTFSMSSGSELRVGDLNASGAIQNSTTVGNIRVPVASRTYHSQAIINYNGAGSQSIGVGHPPVNTVISTNTSLVQNNLTVNSLTLLNGNLSAGTRILNVAGDWIVNGGFFAHGTGGVNFTGTSVFQGTGPFGFHTVNIMSTGNVTLPSNNVSVTGNFAVDPSSTLNSGSGTLVFNGGIGQTLNANGKTLNNILVNKTGGDVSLGTSLNLQGTLTMQSSSTFRTNGLLTLLSTNDNPAQDASIAALPAGASIVGNVTVQRYMRTADNYDRFISMPISNATVAQLQDDFPITGDFPDTSFPCTGCTNNGPSLERYIETYTGDFFNGYTPVPAPGGSSSTVLQPGVGYDAYMWNGVAPITWDVTGTINSGTINFTVSHNATSPANPSADGWNLLGNPYPSAIQWNNGTGWSRSNIDPTVWVWDVVGRVWRTYNYLTQSGNLSNGVIAAGQAFWVWVPTAGSASMSINEQAKSTSGSGTFYRQRTTEQTGIVATLSNGKFSDEAFVLIDERATSEFDSGLDCPKLELGIERMHISFMENDYSLGFLAAIPKFEKDIPIRVAAEEEGQYVLSLESKGNFSLDGYYLFDVVLQKATPLKSSRVKFTYSKSDPKTRFFISRNAQPSVRQTELSVNVFPNPTRDQFSLRISASTPRSIELLNSKGSFIMSTDVFEFDGESYSKTISLNNQPGGMYLIKVRTTDGVIIKRVVKY